MDNLDYVNRVARPAGEAGRRLLAAEAAVCGRVLLLRHNVHQARSCVAEYCTFIQVLGSDRARATRLKAGVQRMCLQA